MPFQDIANTIHWKLHFVSPPHKVFEALITNEGRASFWAESAKEQDGQITFNILNYAPWTGNIVISIPPEQFSVEYFGTQVDFLLKADNNGGTDLVLNATEVDESIKSEMTAGWVSVLMAMKAYVDHGVDLRNHDPQRTWSAGYADN